MGTKRPFQEDDSQDRDNEAGENASSQTVKRQKHFGKSKHKAKQGTSEFAKKRVRNIERLLQRKQDLPANVQDELTRELASHKKEIADKTFQKKRSAMISKYHMVRFFERRKAARLVKQLKRQIEMNPDSDDLEQLRKDLHTAEVDEAYTLYFPHLEPYVSLYGSSASQAADADEGEGKEPTAKISLKSGRPPMWAVIEKTMEEGPEALTSIRERWLDEGDAARKKSSRQTPRAQMSKADSGPMKQSKKQATARNEAKSGVSSDKKSGNQQQLNRRERRRLMHQAKAEAEASDEEGAGDFFEIPTAA